MSHDDTPTVEVNLTDVPTTWTDDDRERVERIMSDLARTIEAKMREGATGEEVVAGFQSFAAAEGVEADMQYDPGEGFTILVGEEARSA